jgi:hypothetical protein
MHWTGQSSLSWITDELAVGGRIQPGDERLLARDYGVRRFVDVRAECCDDLHVLRKHEIRLLHVPVDDGCPFDEARLRAAVRWVLSALQRGEKVVIHCEYGIGRSALLAGAVLVSRGLSPLEALRLLKTRRPLISPSPGQLQCLIQFAAAWHRHAGTPSPTEAWTDLADIAYAEVLSAA